MSDNNAKKIAAGIGYSGIASISTWRGKTKLSETSAHNEGRDMLFKFIANALAGDFNRATRPCQIKLFSLSASAGDDIDNPKKPDTWKFDEKLEISSMIHYTSAASPKASQDKKAKVTYVFRIPYSIIYGDKIYKIALYGANASDLSADMCAVIGKTKETESGID